MKKIKLLFYLLFFFTLIFIRVDYASAETTGFRVEPIIFDLKIEKGETLEKKLKVKNISNSILPINLVLRNYSPKDLNIFDWIKLQDTYFILEPNEEKIIDFSITAPQEAENMSHLLFLSVESQIEKISNTSRAITMIAAPLLLAVVNKNEQIETRNISIEEITLLPQSRSKILEKIVNQILGIESASAFNNILIANSDILDFKIKIKNYDKYHSYPQGALRIFDKENHILSKADIDGGAVLPGLSKDYYLKLNMANSSVYDFLRQNRIVANIDKGNSKEMFFWFFDIQKALYIVLGLALIVIISFIFKKYSVFLKRQTLSFWTGGVEKVGSFFKGYPKKKKKAQKKKKKGGENKNDKKNEKI